MFLVSKRVKIILWIIMIVLPSISVAQPNVDSIASAYWSFTPAMSFGYSIPLGECGDKFRNGDFTGVDISLGRNKLFLIGSFSGTTNSLIDSLNYGVEWKSPHYLASLSFECGLGYALLHTRYFQYVPFISAGGVTFDLMQKDPITALDRTKSLPSFSIKSILYFNFFGNTDAKPGRWAFAYFVRVMVGYYPIFYQQHFMLNGGQLVGSLGFGWHVGYRKNKKSHR
jgi:hypothetical protein